MACSERCSNYGLELILVFFGIFMSIGFVITYIIAVQEKHVTAFLPYISDTGGKVPESCVFTFVCGVGTIFLLVVLCLRYRHLHHYYHRSMPEMHCVNTSSLVAGLISALGLLTVGSFQNDNVATMHFIGAFMAFGSGIVYFWFQCIITVRLWRSRMTPYVGPCMVLTRIFTAAFSTIMLVTTFVTAMIALQRHNKTENAAGSFFWEAEDGGYTFHVISTGTEWLLALSFVFFFLTFHADFTRIQLDCSVRLKYDHHTDVIHRPSIISTDDENTPLTI